MNFHYEAGNEGRRRSSSREESKTETKPKPTNRERKTHFQSFVRLMNWAVKHFHLQANLKAHTHRERGREGDRQADTHTRSHIWLALKNMLQKFLLPSKWLESSTAIKSNMKLEGESGKWDRQRGEEGWGLAENYLKQGKEQREVEVGGGVGSWGLQFQHETKKKKKKKTNSI